MNRELKKVLMTDIAREKKVVQLIKSNQQHEVSLLKMMKRKKYDEKQILELTNRKNILKLECIELKKSQDEEIKMLLKSNKILFDKTTVDLEQKKIQLIKT